MDVLAARRHGLVDQTVGNEIVVYDDRTKRAHALDGLSAAVWPYCDGTSIVATVAEELGVGLDDVHTAADELAAAGLVERSGVSRRSALRRGALVAGGALVAVPISSVLVPAAAGAASNGGGGGGGGGPQVTVVANAAGVRNCGVVITATGLPPNTTALFVLSTAVPNVGISPTSGPPSGDMTDANGGLTWTIPEVGAVQSVSPYGIVGPLSATAQVIAFTSPQVKASAQFTINANCIN
jgi:hypothetical protein